AVSRQRRAVRPAAKILPRIGLFQVDAVGGAASTFVVILIAETIVIDAGTLAYGNQAWNDGLEFGDVIGGPYRYFGSGGGGVVGEVAVGERVALRTVVVKRGNAEMT